MREKDRERERGRGRKGRRRKGRGRKGEWERVGIIFVNQELSILCMFIDFEITIGAAIPFPHPGTTIWIPSVIMSLFIMNKVLSSCIQHRFFYFVEE